MTRPLALLVAVVALTGCRGSTSSTTIDPFFGPTRVEPPRTGYFPGQPTADPYYSGPPQTTLPQSAATNVPSNIAPAPTTPWTGNQYQPPGGSFNYRGSSVGRSSSAVASKSGDRITIPPDARRPPDRSKPRAARTGLAASTRSDARSGQRNVDDSNGLARRAAATPSAVATAGLPSSPKRIVQTIQPRPADSPGTSPSRSASQAAASTVPTFRSQTVPGKAVDIMDLPPTPTSGRTQPASDDSYVRPAFGTDEDSGSVVRIPTFEGRRDTPSKGVRATAFSSRARYDFDPQYQWLRGKLDYSQVDRRWKLRYIPIDGKTDDFGGSVVLKDTPLLNGYERGNFVEVRGQVSSLPTGTHGFAPDFEASAVARLDP